MDSERKAIAAAHKSHREQLADIDEGLSALMSAACDAVSLDELEALAALVVTTLDNWGVKKDTLDELAETLQQAADEQLDAVDELTEEHEEYTAGFEDALADYIERGDVQDRAALLQFHNGVAVS